MYKETTSFQAPKTLFDQQDLRSESDELYGSSSSDHDYYQDPHFHKPDARDTKIAQRDRPWKHKPRTDMSTAIEFDEDLGSYSTSVKKGARLSEKSLQKAQHLEDMIKHVSDFVMAEKGSHDDYYNRERHLKGLFNLAIPKQYARSSSAPGLLTHLAQAKQDDTTLAVRQGIRRKKKKKRPLVSKTLPPIELPSIKPAQVARSASAAPLEQQTILPRAVKAATSEEQFPEGPTLEPNERDVFEPTPEPTLEPEVTAEAETGAEPAESSQESSQRTQKTQRSQQTQRTRRELPKDIGPGWSNQKVVTYRDYSGHNTQRTEESSRPLSRVGFGGSSSRPVSRGFGSSVSRPVSRGSNLAKKRDSQESVASIDSSLKGTIGQNRKGSKDPAHVAKARHRFANHPGQQKSTPTGSTPNSGKISNKQRSNNTSRRGSE
eukprot:CAMPEP_0175120446 /NCGR_PEP_ID=MMETSP0087-20121206/626_1 /TAXON_ID=136419 /ORGANISM="Unknown Unknown, Strain D1" /LENGTH=432 /DNA_ID=CAMNT_0016401895 /DNA_START=38 /DNA_END=1333 /DNA_ORIENTATION=-